MNYYLDPSPEEMKAVYDFLHRGWLELTGDYPDPAESGTIVMTIGIMNAYFAKDHETSA